MPGWLARPLRRFAGTAVMLIGGQSLVHGHLYPGPQMPPADTDLVRLPAMDGTREITDPATVAQLTAFVRGVRGSPLRMSENRAHFYAMPTACFHRTAAHPADETFTCLAYGEDSIILPARHDVLIYRIGPDQGARFGRLVEYGVAVSGR